MVVLNIRLKMKDKLDKAARHNTMTIIRCTLHINTGDACVTAWEEQQDYG